MSMSPNDISGRSDASVWTAPLARRPWPLQLLDPSSPDPAQDRVPGPSAPLSAGQAPPPTADPQQSLTKLIGQLSSQLRSIEKTFMDALRDLARGVETAGTSSSVAPPPRGASTPTKNANPYDGLIRRTAARHELDPALLSAVIRQESGFDPSARSRAGAMGLMQLMPDTAKSLGVTNAFDPAQNVEGGARLLRGLIDQYGGRLDLALAAYNAGSGAVDKYHGVPPYAETRGYVHAILQEYEASALRA